MQVDLLRVLEEKKITKIGDRFPIDVDFRLISATRRDLKGALSEGSFREDLFYRLNVITITVPPLRKRKEDIPLLVQHFLKKYQPADNQESRSPHQRRHPTSSRL